MGILNFGVQIALNRIKEKVMNPRLDGIGTIEEFAYKDKKLFCKLRLEGLEDHPLEVVCEDIRIAEDGSNLIINKFIANKKFLQTTLDNFMAGRIIEIPEGGARLGVVAAKKLLGL